MAGIVAFHTVSNSWVVKRVVTARRGSPMFMILMDAIAWLIVIGLGYLALMLAGAALGALIGNFLALFRRKPKPNK